jgi:hypothetical protein
MPRRVDRTIEIQRHLHHVTVFTASDKWLVCDGGDVYLNNGASCLVTRTPVPTRIIKAAKNYTAIFTKGATS